MGGFFGVVSKEDAIADVFFGTDYHSHLGTRRGGMASWATDIGLQREIHNIQNSPFRTKFDGVFDEMHGTSAIGIISDFDPQPLLIRGRLGKYAICVIGVVNNADELIDRYLADGGQFNAMTSGNVNSTELIAALINQKDSFAEGIKFAQEQIDGTASILILKEGGNIIVARDRLGRIPVSIGKNLFGYAVSFEAFAYQKLGYEDERELGPGEVVELSTDSMTQLVAPGKKMKMCAFLWTYYGFPTSTYEGVNVELMRYRNGKMLADADRERGLAQDIDYVGGVPDSGVPHAIGYANASHKPYSRAFIKYTPTWARSFTSPKQEERAKVAKMKQIPVHEIINGNKLLFVDDSIVRGTQLKGTVDFLYDHGAKEVHMRSACPPVLYNCKFLNFSRSNNEMELIARQTIMELEGEEGFEHLEEYSDGGTKRGKALRKAICKKLNFATLDFQSLKGVIESIGIGEENLCTYCWNGKE